MNPFKELIQSNRAWYCLDCGKCSSVCPISLYQVAEYTSPRLFIETALVCGEASTFDNSLLWSCLTCGRCTEICPSEVGFLDFIQEARQIARGKDLSGDCTHSGMIETWGRMMTDPKLQQNRLDWVGGDLELSADGDTIYFPGCLPYYQAAFGDLGIDGIGIATAAVKILNALGIQPQVLADERCCGHDQFWQGDLETFQRLAKLNLDLIRSTGAKRLITTCPECAYTLKNIYPEQVGDLGMEVLHLTELLAGTELAVQKADLPGPGAARATYQDPCRLGRFSGIYQEPRDLIEASGFQLVEMEHTGRASICCGTSCWSTCGQVNKKIQTERLKEARLTGAEILITACIKCQIHFKCAQHDSNLAEENQIVIRDITSIIAEQL